jgi:hypothetical protein
VAFFLLYRFKTSFVYLRFALRGDRRSSRRSVGFPSFAVERHQNASSLFSQTTSQ